MTLRRFRGQVAAAGGGLEIELRVPPRPPAAPAPPDPLDVLIDAPDGTVGVAYEHTYTARGGTPPYRWTLTPGVPDVTAELPFDAATATFAGTPSTEATYQFRVEVSDAAGNRVRAGDAIKIAAESSELALTGTPPSGTAGVEYTFEWGITGGTPPYTVTAMDWTPNPFNISTDFGPPPSVFGTSAEATTLSITITVEDSAVPPNSVTETYSIEML